MVDHDLAIGPQNVTYPDQRTGPVTVLDLPCLLRRPTSTRAADPHLRVVAEVHHAIQVVRRPAAPALTRRRISGPLTNGEWDVHGQALAALAARALRAWRRAPSSGTFRGPSGVRYTRQANAPSALPISKRSTPSTTNAGEPANRQALAASSLSMVRTANAVPAKPMSSSALRSSADAASLPGHPGITSTSTSTPAS